MKSKKSIKKASGIDRKAMIGRGAKIGKNVTVGAYAFIASRAQIGDGTVVEPFARVMDYTRIGEKCRIFSYSVIGNDAQDLKYKGEKTFLTIGDNNIFREFVTVNRATVEGSSTSIGNGNLFMAYTHIAHDCVVGNNNVFANNATLAGCVGVGNSVVIGGLTAIHQFCRVGDYAIIGGCSKVVQDIPPYSMCDGHPAIVCGLNIVGLRRAGFSAESINTLKKAFKVLFFENYPFTKAVEIIKQQFSSTRELNTLVDFVSSSKRGIGR